MICRIKKCGKEIPEESSFCLYCGASQVAKKRRARKRANGEGSVYKMSGNRAKPSDKCTDRKGIAMVGGHTDPSFTEKTYVQPDIDRLRRVVESI